MTRRWFVIFLAGFGLLLVSCSTGSVPDQPRVGSQEFTLSSEHTFGQTFVARYAGLDGVSVFLSPGQSSAGQLRLHLRTDAQSTRDLLTAGLPLTHITQPAFYTFSFPPLSDSDQRYYYAFVEVEGDGETRVGTAAGDTYLDGALYQDHQSLDAQMTFRLRYSPWQLSVGFGQTALRWLGILGIGILLYVVPGWALLVLFWPEAGLSWAEKLGLAAGLSLAFYPLLFLWTDLVGLHLGPVYAWLSVGLGLIVIGWRERLWQPRRLVGPWRLWWGSKARLPDLVLLGIIGLIFLVRLLVIRSLEIPLWADSYHHTMIAQLLVDQHGLFDSWQPYADLTTFTYHFGFHAAVAVLHWMTGLEMSKATLWTGQLLNGLAVLALYLLTVQLSGKRWAGVGAVLLAGLLFPLPMYYMNWGRYTQLAGQVLLPGIIYLMWVALKSDTKHWGTIALSWILLGGLALTHYRVLILGLLFLPPLFLLEARKARWGTLIDRLFWLGLGAGLLFLPWFIHTFAGQITLYFAKQLTTSASQTSTWTREYNAISPRAQYLPPLFAIAWLFIIGWSLRQRQKAILLWGLWWLLILLAANPQWLQLPGEGVISNFAWLIAAYIPAAILGGAVVSWVAEKLSSRQAWFRTFCLVAVGTGLVGAAMRLNDLTLDSSGLVTVPDLHAAAWIQENTPTEAKFLVNSAPAYGGSLIVGSDGGWWLPLLAQRNNSVPPLTYSFEQGSRPDYVSWIKKLSVAVHGKSLNDPEVLSLLREHSITHVYIGQRQGQVNYNGPTLEPAKLLVSSHFHLIYHQDRIWVFEFVQ